MRSKAAGCLAAAVLATTLGAAWGASPASAAVTPPVLRVSAAAMIEASTGKLIYVLHPQQELAIASATKIMTALVTLEHARLNQVFTEPAYYPAPDDSQIGLLPGQQMTVHDLLIALLLPSADDAAEDLAFGVGHGSISRFVAMMNAQARRLGLRHTHYSTPIGLDTPGNYSSAADLLALTRFVMNTQPFFHQTVARSSASVWIGRTERVLTNLNTLVGRVPWITGVKTGYTREAGYVLVGSGTRNGMTLISAVLGAPNENARENDTFALLQYGFSAFHLVTPVRARAVLARPTVTGYTDTRAQLFAARTFTEVLPRSTRVHVRIKAPATLTGPLLAHAVLGRAIVLVGGRHVAAIPLLLRRAIPTAPTQAAGGAIPAAPTQAAGGADSGVSTLLVSGLLLFAGGFARIRRGERHRLLPAPSHRPE